MRRADRLFAIITILRDGRPHRAQDIAARLNVSVRSIYRDMERLAAAGVPVDGTRGTGYRVRDTVALPPLSLTEAELQALNLGIAIVAEAADPELNAAARSLAGKIDAVLPAETIAEADAWKFALHPFADAARGLSHMATLRSAIEGRQKLDLGYRQTDGALVHSTVRPLMLDYFGRVWTLIAWCESIRDFREFRLDLMETARPLPELFVDEPGKRLPDFRRAVP
ncbi:MAG: helix-turn-helix transcriptional regulator [Jhaorihella sp.]